MCISQYLNSDEQPCREEEQYDCKRCMGRLFAMSVPVDTEVLDKLGARSPSTLNNARKSYQHFPSSRKCTNVLKL